MTAQLGDGAAIAAETGLPVVSDLRAMDLALGGQGAPIVPIGERLLWEGYDYFLNIGGIANISANRDPYIAFDICPANRVLNMLAAEKGQEYDAGGILAAGGQLRNDLVEKLNALDYISCPELENRTIIISDPMLATGSSLVKTIHFLREEGRPREIHIVAAIACTVGIEYVKREEPSVTIWCGDIDDELTAKGYIVPGLGDAGDLAYGVKVQM